MFSSNLFRTHMLVTLATIALATAACGGGDDSTGPTPAPATNGTLFVSNDSDRSIWYVFTRTCGATAWSEDHLESDIIPQETSQSFTLAGGCYDGSSPLGARGRTGRPEARGRQEQRDLARGRSVDRGGEHLAGRGVGERGVDVTEEQAVVDEKFDGRSKGEQLRAITKLLSARCGLRLRWRGVRAPHVVDDLPRPVGLQCSSVALLHA